MSNGITAVVAAVQAAVMHGQSLPVKRPLVSSSLGMAVGLALAARAFWASARPDYEPRNRRTVLVAGVLMGVLQLAAALVASFRVGSVSWPRLGVLVGHPLWPAACLVASHLGVSSRLDEPGASRPLAP